MSVTESRDLRTGRSVWQHRRLPLLPSTDLRRHSTTDVLVVGAGISGAMIAEALSASGRRVLVVDRRRPLTGSTTASTALIQYELDTPLSHLVGRLGWARAERIWRRSKLALDALRERVQALALDAEVTETPSLYLSGDVLAGSALGQEAAMRRRAGFEVEWLDSRQVKKRFGIRGHTALLTHGAVTADPRRLAHGFLRGAIAAGARLAWPVDIVGVDPARRHVQAISASGAIVNAGVVVFATGYELAHGVPRRGHAITSTWAMATRPQRHWSWPTGPAVIWEASSPYLYLRPGPDNRLICGGEDEAFADATSRDALIAAKTATLERRLAALLPGVDARSDYAWAGTFGSSSTGTPSIGSVPGLPGCLAALGYGGNGITFSMLAAQLVRTHVLGQHDADAELFSFRRRRR